MSDPEIMQPLITAISGFIAETGKGIGDREILGGTIAALLINLTARGLDLDAAKAAISFHLEKFELVDDE